VPDSVRASALAALAFCLGEPDTFEEAEAAARESLELARSIGDIAQCSECMGALAAAALNVHHVDDAYRYATEAQRLAEAAGDEPKRLGALHTRAMMAPTLDEALALGEQAATAYRRTGSGRRLALLQTSLTYTALFHGDHAAARRLSAEALESGAALGDPLVLSFCWGNEGLAALVGGDTARAAEAFPQGIRLASRYGYDRMFYEAISGVAGVVAARGEDELAARLIGAAEITGGDRHDPVIAQQLEERYFAAARARLGEQAWRAAHAAGAASTPHQAVELALAAAAPAPSGVEAA
jgi:hypothetical protein